MAGGVSVDVIVIGAGRHRLQRRLLPGARWRARAGRGARRDRPGGLLGLPPAWSARCRLATTRSPASIARASTLFPQFAATIREETGIDIGYWRCGSLRLCRNAAEWPAWEREIPDAARRRRRSRVLDRRDYPRPRAPRWPRTRSARSTIPTAGQVRPPRSACAPSPPAPPAWASTSSTGEPMMDFARCGQSRHRRCNPGRHAVPAGTVVVAAGAWSGEIARFTGRSLAVAPARGQIVLLETLPPRLSGARVRWRLLPDAASQMARSCWGAPWSSSASTAARLPRA